MGDGLTLARGMIAAVGSEVPVQPHCFALEHGVRLVPSDSGIAALDGDVITFNATEPLSNQECVVLDLFARWALRRAGVAENIENVAEMVDCWLDPTGACGAETAASAS